MCWEAACFLHSVAVACGCVAGAWGHIIILNRCSGGTESNICILTNPGLLGTIPSLPTGQTRVWLFGRPFLSVEAHMHDQLLAKQGGLGQLCTVRPFASTTGLTCPYPANYTSPPLPPCSSRDNIHFPAWVNFNKVLGGEDAGDAIGVWHETYVVRQRMHEMPLASIPVHMHACTCSNAGPTVAFLRPLKCKCCVNGCCPADQGRHL
jgi:hypothetical protein